MSRSDEPKILTPEMFRLICLAAVRRMDLPDFCRIRRCRRRGACSGGAVPRIVPTTVSGEPAFSALLPRCIAKADDDWLGCFALYWQTVHDDCFDPPPLRPPLDAADAGPLWAIWPAETPR